MEDTGYHYFKKSRPSSNEDNINNPNININMGTPLTKAKQASTKKIGIYNNTKKMVPFRSVSNKTKFCMQHNKPLEVFCISNGCHKRVCTNCALFGDHKMHKIKSEDDIKAAILKEFSALSSFRKDVVTT